MFRRVFNSVMVLAFACTFLFLGAGCHDSRVVVANHPKYEPPPPPPPGHGPPPWAPAHGRRAKYHYRYYPSCYVYFDVGRRLYFYYERGGWEVSVSLPAHARVDLSEYVVLEMATAKPYEYHGEVVKRYPPGQLKKKSKGKEQAKRSKH
jgi:hypothetical protein